VENVVDIRPGVSVNLIVYVDIRKEISDVRNAIVYDIDGVNIMISQTNPPLAKHHIDKEVTVTYLAKHKSGIRRIGFSGKVGKILYDYNLYSSKTVQAITIIREGGFKTCDLRMHYRVKPRSDSGINIYVKDKKANLIDISIGGVRFCNSRKDPIEPGSIIEIIITLDGQQFSLDAKTVNVWHSSEYANQKDMEYVSVQFLNVDKICSHLLSGKILSIQRELLSKT
jgi:hypothetical protein